MLKSETEMITNFEDFRRARDLAERISVGTVTNIRQEISDAGSSIQDTRIRKDFYDYLSSLLLNTALNRVEELGEAGKERALEGRRIIREITTNL